MKKKYLLFILNCFIILSPIFSQEEKQKTDYFTKDHLGIKYELGLAFNSQEGWETYNASLQPYIQVDSTKITLYSGMQVAKGDFDFTGGAVLWPLVRRNIRVGAGARYNFNWYDNLSYSHNVYLGSYFEARPGKWFGVKFDIGYMAKARCIKAIEDYTKYLKYHMLGFCVEADFYLPYNFMVYTKISSYELYRYMVNIAPTFTIGITETTTYPYYISVELNTRYTDFFTSSTFLDSRELRILLGAQF